MHKHLVNWLSFYLLQWHFDFDRWETVCLLYFAISVSSCSGSWRLAHYRKCKIFTSVCLFASSPGIPTYMHITSLKAGKKFQIQFSKLFSPCFIYVLCWCKNSLLGQHKLFKILNSRIFSVFLHQFYTV